MTAMRARQQFVAMMIIAFGFGFSQLAANELNDSIQFFHQGNYQSAYDGLSELVQQGEQDARVHYYRGLISFRQGNRAAAAMDFQTAMQLEASGRSNGVSEALQRVQGHERLVVEKYRAMARLAAKRRQQPVAPPVQVIANPIQLVTAQSAVPQTPMFRLASEVPIRNPKSKDPFADDIKNILADDVPEKPILMPSASNDDSSNPVGTGVATGGDDPFAGVDGLGVSEERGKPASVMGAVFRAITRATVPNVQGVLPPGVAPGIPTGGEAAFEPASDGDSPFGDDAFDAADDGDDPFADF